MVQLVQSSRLGGAGFFTRSLRPLQPQRQSLKVVVRAQQVRGATLPTCLPQEPAHKLLGRKSTGGLTRKRRCGAEA